MAGRGRDHLDARTGRGTRRPARDRCPRPARHPRHRPAAFWQAAMTQGGEHGEPVRVLIADDHPLFRDGLAALLHASPGTELAGAAVTGTEAVELARQAQPDVVLMDLRLPGLNGIEATRQIVVDSPHPAVVVLTMF